ncbi:hypothetical protein PP935_gp246 [Rhizobium phage RHph_N34]|uniref:Uncharacterized protein n=1 Tax=Rhizobium phage RHph_N34 TaxID=2509586 RepID=A0A7S5RAB8_9CAUD|nr:hypothetical protein PP935_gp246 [Rhizobium phage RHph_N34]QIG74021.1 hypothetical protein EVC06_246 [Rhizobium phage RHph_N34]
MTSISSTSNTVSFYSFLVFQGTDEHPCYSIGAHGRNELDALQNAISLYKTALKDFGENLDYQCIYTRRKDNGNENG